MRLACVCGVSVRCINRFNYWSYLNTSQIRKSSEPCCISALGSAVGGYRDKVSLLFSIRRDSFALTQRIETALGDSYNNSTDRVRN